jgi:plastocyanin
MPTRRSVVQGVAVGAAALLAGCAGGGDGTEDEPTPTPGSELSVTVTDNRFDPLNAEVEQGGTVTWVNEGERAHTVTSASDNWSKDTEIAAGGETTHTFEESGVYDVYCRFHGSSDLSGMAMKVAVGDATIENPLGEDSGATTTEDGGVSY